jgi:endonuclease YncB( thermonuclease family)
MLTPVLVSVLLGTQMVAGAESPAGKLTVEPSAGPAQEKGSAHRHDAQTSNPAAGLAGQPETNSISNVLSLLVTSSETRQFAGELERLLRQGKLEAAEHRLNSAVEIGTVAILLTDRLRDPKLLAGLQALGIQSEDRPMLSLDKPNDTPALSPDVPGNPRTAHKAEELADLNEAKEREQQRADASARELANVTEELRTLRATREQEVSAAAANAAQLGDLKVALRREQERADAVARDLVAVTKERHTLQTLREHDATLIASNRAELEALKAALEQERQQGLTTGTLTSKTENPLEIKTADPGAPAAKAGFPSASTPSVTVQEMAAVPAGAERLRGVPEVVNTSTLSLQGRIVRLFGVETAGDVSSAGDLTQYLGGREVVCEVAGSKDIYRCQVDGKDLSIVVLFNGGGRATVDATFELRTAAERARSAGVGIWSK